MRLFPKDASAGRDPSPAHRPGLQALRTSARSRLSRLAASVLCGAALALPVRAYDLQYRQNGTRFSAAELRGIFSNALPAAYDQRFPEERWTTYLLLDAHADQGLVAITLGLSPRLGPSQALLPVATFSVIEPLPRSAAQWQQRLSDLFSRCAGLMLANRSRIVSPP